MWYAGVLSGSFCIVMFVMITHSGNVLGQSNGAVLRTRTSQVFVFRGSESRLLSPIAGYACEAGCDSHWRGVETTSRGSLSIRGCTGKLSAV